MSVETAIKILRLVVVLPIALVLIILLPLLELLAWVADDCRPSWASGANEIILRIAKFIWP